MKSLFQQESRNKLLTRLNQLNPDQQPLWGKMNSTQMLCHLGDALRMALGELEVSSKAGPLRYPPLKQLVVYWLPWPKGAPTAPELIKRRSDNWQGEKDAVEILIGRFGERQSGGQWPEHAAFGKLSGRAWGVLQYRHLDHHFRQFGA